SDRRAQRHPWLRRSIRPKRATTSLSASVDPTEARKGGAANVAQSPRENVVFRHFSEYGSVRASGGPLLAAYAPIAVWPKGGNHGPRGRIGRNREPCARLMVVRSPSVRIVDAGRAASGARGPPSATVRRGACSARAGDNRSSVADGPWADAMTAKSRSSW